jgi:lysozyme
MKKGIDVSYAQGVIDWEAVKNSGNEFAILRAGYGMGHIDSQFARNAAECNRLGIPIGVYWFGYALSADEAAQEAQKCVEAIKTYKITYPVCYDYEYDSVRYAKNKGVSIGREQATAFARAFLDAIKAAGYIPGLYSNYDYAKNMFDLSQLPYDLWYAWYNNTCNRSDDLLWQYSSSGVVNGISGKVDLDYALKDYTGSGASPAPVEKKYDGSVGGFQEWLNDNYSAGLAVDNDFGPLTKKAAVEAWQSAMNEAFGCGLDVDGSYGSQSSAAAKKHLIKQGASGNLVYIIQGMLYCCGYDPNGLDGGFGSCTKAAAIKFQAAKHITADGTVGAETDAKFFA